MDELPVAHNEGKPVVIDVHEALQKKKSPSSFFIITVLLLLGATILVGLMTPMFLPKYNKTITQTTVEPSQVMVSLQTQYQNPFDKSTQYANPFAYTNPFDNLK